MAFSFRRQTWKQKKLLKSGTKISFCKGLDIKKLSSFQIVQLKEEETKEKRGIANHENLNVGVPMPRALFSLLIPSISIYLHASTKVGGIHDNSNFNI